MPRLPEAIFRANSTPQIMADAAHWLFSQLLKSYTGDFFIDEEVLKFSGITDFSCYAMNPDLKLRVDLFL